MTRHFELGFELRFELYLASFRQFRPIMVHLDINKGFKPKNFVKLAQNHEA